MGWVKKHKWFKCSHKGALDFPEWGHYLCTKCKRGIIYDAEKYKEYLQFKQEQQIVTTESIKPLIEKIGKA